MNEPHFDFGIPQPDRRPITIRVVNSMLLRRIDGEALEHIEAGSVVTIPRHDLGSLSPGDWQPVPHDLEVTREGGLFIPNSETQKHIDTRGTNAQDRPAMKKQTDISSAVRLKITRPSPKTRTLSVPVTSERKVPVSERAIVARLKRALGKEGMILKKSRGEAATFQMGEWYLVSDRNLLLSDHIDIEEWSREKGLLAPYEVIAE